MEDKQKVKVTVETVEVKDAMKKVKKLKRLLKEANSLADELASKDFKITISTKYSDPD